MSMNLECEQVVLWQTPTYITKMCYSNGDGGWKGILYRYTQWVAGTKNGVWESSEEYYEHAKSVDEHVKELSEAASIHGKLDFCVV